MAPQVLTQDVLAQQAGHPAHKGQQGHIAPAAVAQGGQQQPGGHPEAGPELAPLQTARCHGAHRQQQGHGERGEGEHKVVEYGAQHQSDAVGQQF